LVEVVPILFLHSISGLTPLPEASRVAALSDWMQGMFVSRWCLAVHLQAGPGATMHTPQSHL